MTKEVAELKIIEALGDRQHTLVTFDTPDGPMAVVKRSGREFTVLFHKDAGIIHDELIAGMVSQYDKQDWRVTT